MKKLLLTFFAVFTIIGGVWTITKAIVSTCNRTYNECMNTGNSTYKQCVSDSNGDDALKKMCLDGKNTDVSDCGKTLRDCNIACDGTYVQCMKPYNDTFTKCMKDSNGEAALKKVCFEDRKTGTLDCGNTLRACKGSRFILRKANKIGSL